MNAKLPGTDTARGGRVVAVIGACGGVGATTIAANLAWYLGVVAKRHTVFVEADIYTESGTLLIGGKTGPGLRMALEAPERIDPLFVERAAQIVAGRLSILAGEEKLTYTTNYAPGAAQRLITALRLSYNFVILDVPFLPLPMNRELLEFNHQRVIISDATLPSIHDTVRLLELPNGLWQPQSPTVVLNREGRVGTLSRKAIEASAKLKFDVAIPDLPEILHQSESFGEPAVMKAGPFRDAIMALAEQIGFVGNRDRTAHSAARDFSFRGLLRRLMPQHG